jgi:hypothetical protein
MKQNQAGALPALEVTTIPKELLNQQPLRRRLMPAKPSKPDPNNSSEAGSGAGTVAGRNSPASLDEGNSKVTGATIGVPDVTSVRLNEPLLMLHPNSLPGVKDKPLKSTVFPKTVKFIAVSVIVTIGSDAQGPMHSTVYVPNGVVSAWALEALTATTITASMIHNGFRISICLFS